MKRMRSLIACTVLFAIVCCVACNPFAIADASSGGGVTALDYNKQRADISGANDYITSVGLSDAEARLDDILQELKEEYSKSTGGNADYSIPVLSDETIWLSKLYQLCIDIPKGSDLHVHASALLPVKELADFLSKRSDVEICTSGDQKYVLFLSANAERPDSCKTMAEALSDGSVSFDELLSKWTILGAAEQEDIWVFFETLFDKDMVLSSGDDLMQDYYEYAFRYYYKNNIKHLEIRALFFGTNEEAAQKAITIRNAYYKVRDEYPDMIVSIVGCGLKRTNIDEVVTDVLMDNNLFVYENVKDEYNPNQHCDFMVGIDLVNEEDDSRPLSFYRDMIETIKAKHPELRVLLHAGESLHADSDNLIDAYLLGSKRVGHGLNLYRYPSLLDLFIEDDICLEVCPISNNTLRYVHDLRLHPGLEYLKRGVPMVLASDDPSYQEHTSLVDDFFAAIVAWDLGVAEIKQLCMNSITYSATSESNKEYMTETWINDWDLFVHSYADQE